MPKKKNPPASKDASKSSKVEIIEPGSKKSSKKDKKKGKSTEEPENNGIFDSTMSLSKRRVKSSSAQIANFLQQIAAKREADEWTWESYSVPSESILSKSEEELQKKQKSKVDEVHEAEVTAVKSKPGKKGKGKDKGAAAGGKKKKGPKLSFKEMEALRIKEELDAKRAEEEDKQRKLAERKAGIAKEKQDSAEQTLRTEQLNNSIHLIAGIRRQIVENAVQQKHEREWQQYLICDGLPDPYVSKQMNTYLHQWNESMEQSTIQDASRRTKEVLKLLKILTSFIDDPLGMNNMELANWKWVHQLFREYQQRSIDTACYRLLRSIETNMELLNVRIAEYRHQEDDIAMCLWMRVKMPKSECRGWRAPRTRIELEFPELQMNVFFPKQFDGLGLAIRAMYLKYDHVSDLCSSFYPPPLPKLFSHDINSITVREWRSKLLYKYEQYLLAEQANEQPITTGAKQVVTLESEDIPTVPYQKLDIAPSIHVVEQEDEVYAEVYKSLRTKVSSNVINLRKFLIVGGVFFLDLYEQPPQPRQMASFDLFVTRLKMPTCLEEVSMYIEYNPPPPLDPTEYHEPQELEEDLKKQEAALDQLVSVSVTLPEHVIWLDVPLVAYWNKQKKFWTSRDVHDVKHIEEKNTITFRTASFGCFAFALNRYANLPYQAWELKPEEDRSVTLQITAAILMLEFNIKNNLVCIRQLQNSPNKALQNILGVYLRLPAIVRALRDGGIDVFPEVDAYSYVAAACPKHWQMENHAYYNMAQLAGAFYFVWSRWNYSAGRRNIILQMREHKFETKKRDVVYSTLHITPLKAVFIDCTEVSQEFNPVPIEGMLFYSDLYNLMRGTSSIATRSKLQSMPADLVGTVADLLLATRVLSFS